MKVAAISILVPVYKVEAYLQRCIDSVLAQDFTDWEMILVDDGSPDQCPKICDEAARKDERIKVVHKENGGLPSARLAGFEQAKGEYLVFLDSDDWLMPNTLITLYHYIQSGEYDIVRGCNRRVNTIGEYTIERGKFHHGEIVGSDRYLEKVITAELESYLWGAIYKRELFSQATFTPILSLSVGEDWMTNIAIGKNVQKVLCIEDVVYNYFINPQSMMQERVCSYVYADHVKQILLDITNGCSDHIKDLILANRTMATIQCFFVPELGFSTQHYVQIQNDLSNERLYKLTETLLHRKFSLFIKNRILFYIYSRIYCFLFKLLKLKGKSRKII